MHAVETALERSWTPHAWADLNVLLAVSGGADSMALLRAMVALRPASASGALIVAHCNHHLRGPASDDDERFVVEAAQQLNLRCEVGHCPIAEADCRDGLETAARAARYQFLLSTAERLGARYLATAHTADDQAETILHRIIRGTGIAGLSGMRRARPLSAAVTLIRPLLAARRAELRDYLLHIGQPFRDDESNVDRRFTRNRLRHDVLPILAEIHPAVVESLLRLGNLASEAQAFLDEAAAEALESALLRRGPRELVFDARRLRDFPPYVVREALLAAWRAQGWPLQDMGFDDWRSLAALLDAPGAARTFPANVQALHDDGELRLSR